LSAGGDDPLLDLARRLARGAARQRKRPVPRAAELASFIDHTLLRADATPAQVERLCAEALEHRFASVCVNGRFVERCARALEGSPVAVCTVAGFPLGACAPAVKRIEAARALQDGADEIDAVLALGDLLGGEERRAADELTGLAEDCHAAGARLKVILECGLLDEAAKVRAAELCRAAGCDFLKTSTGWAGSGATLADVELLRRTVGPGMGIKASGGIRDAAFARALIAAGADRIGCSGSVGIVTGGK
jgi:deoxyribose-phosphate aldolase